jgi:hypothetical protein
MRGQRAQKCAADKARLVTTRVKREAVWLERHRGLACSDLTDTHAGRPCGDDGHLRCAAARYGMGEAEMQGRGRLSCPAFRSECQIPLRLGSD